MPSYNVEFQSAVCSAFVLKSNYRSSLNGKDSFQDSPYGKFHFEIETPFVIQLHFSSIASAPERMRPNWYEFLNSHRTCLIGFLLLFLGCVLNLCVFFSTLGFLAKLAHDTDK